MPDKTPQTILDIIAFFTSKPGIGILSFFAGIATAIIPQWNQWLIKKRELKLTNQFNYRKDTIRRWREEMRAYHKLRGLYGTPLYHELCDYIPPEELSALINDNTVVTITDDCQSTRDSRIIARFSKAISDKEKEWGIR